MAYLNHAGTTWPKPGPVREAVAEFVRSDVASWERRWFEDEDRASRGLRPDGGSIQWTPNATSALAVAVADRPWSPGDVALTSSMEHVALERPLAALAARGVRVVRIPRAADGPFDLEAFGRVLRQGPVRLVAISAAANVTGERLPVAAIAAEAREMGAHVLVDGAQTAGWGPDPVRAPAVRPTGDTPWADGADEVAFTGHKALLGLWGIGGLIRRPGLPEANATPRFERTEPSPGYCDLGSLNRAALAGLAAASDCRRAEAWTRCRTAADHLARVLDALPRVQRLHRRRPGDLPTLAFVVQGSTPAEVERECQQQGLRISAGQQCAPHAYRTLGHPDGGLRISLGSVSTDEDVETTEAILRRVLA